MVCGFPESRLSARNSAPEQQRRENGNRDVPAPVMMPITMLQNMNTVSIGSLDRRAEADNGGAPTMPSESTTLERTVKMASAVTIESITSEREALAEADAAVGHAVDHQHEQPQCKSSQAGAS